MLPRIGRSRSDVGGDRSPRRWRSVIAVNALDRTPRPCGFSLTIARARWERMRDPELDHLRSRSPRDRRPAGSCIARIFRGDVPLPVPDLPEPCRNGSIAAPLVGFHALRSVDPDERGWRRCRPSRRPHMPFPERPSRQAVFGREINRLLLSNAPTENACVGRSIQDAHRGSWDFPAVSPRLRRAILSRAAGAILPWAFWVLSQVCRTCARAGCVFRTPAPNACVRERTNSLYAAARTANPGSCDVDDDARGSYPLMGFGKRVAKTCWTALTKQLPRHIRSPPGPTAYCEADT
jgi:hypothetical protein